MYDVVIWIRISCSLFRLMCTKFHKDCSKTERVCCFADRRTDIWTVGHTSTKRNVQAEGDGRTDWC